VAKYFDLDQKANSVLFGMQYTHWLMVAGVVLVVLGSVGFAFRQPDQKHGNEDEWEEVDDEYQAPPAQVPFMITRSQKKRLREMGHDQEAIENMTPEAAHKLLGIGSETNEGAN
jgi:hypothetical protein